MAQGHSGINLTQTVPLRGYSGLLIVLCCTHLLWAHINSVYQGMCLLTERFFFLKELVGKKNLEDIITSESIISKYYHVAGD